MRISDASKRHQDKIKSVQGQTPQTFDLMRNLAIGQQDQRVNPNLTSIERIKFYNERSKVDARQLVQKMKMNGGQGGADPAQAALNEINAEVVALQGITARQWGAVRGGVTLSANRLGLNAENEAFEVPYQRWLRNPNSNARVEQVYRWKNSGNDLEREFGNKAHEAMQRARGLPI